MLIDNRLDTLFTVGGWLDYRSIDNRMVSIGCIHYFVKNKIIVVWLFYLWRHFYDRIKNVLCLIISPLSVRGPPKKWRADQQRILSRIETYTKLHHFHSDGRCHCLFADFICPILESVHKTKSNVDYSAISSKNLLKPGCLPQPPPAISKCVEGFSF